MVGERIRWHCADLLSDNRMVGTRNDDLLIINLIACLTAVPHSPYARINCGSLV